MVEIIASMISGGLGAAIVSFTLIIFVSIDDLDNPDPSTRLNNTIAFLLVCSGVGLVTAALGVIMLALKTFF